MRKRMMDVIEVELFVDGTLKECGKKMSARIEGKVEFSSSNQVIHPNKLAHGVERDFARATQSAPDYYYYYFRRCIRPTRQTRHIYVIFLETLAFLNRLKSCKCLHNLLIRRFNMYFLCFAYAAVNLHRRGRAPAEKLLY